MGRLALLQTSPRVAPGLLTAQAWETLRTADSVLCATSGNDLGRAVSAAGVAVQVVDEPLPGLLSALLSAAAGDQTAVWLAGDDDDDRLADAVAAEVVSRAERGDDTLTVEVLTGSYDVPGSRLLDLVEVMDRLRSECPWDREQTHRSLVRYLVEESYETLEAIETGDRDHLREELGDLLLQVMFHSRIAAEHPDDPWTVDDVAGEIVEKLVRRHPHVFAGVAVTGADEVETNWESIKTAEKQRSSVLEGIPMAMPALSLAEKVLGRAERVGVDLTSADAELKSTGARADAELKSTGARADEDLGARLLALVAHARRTGEDPEQALRSAVRRLSAQIEATETQ